MQNACNMLNEKSRRQNFMYAMKQLYKTTSPYGLAWNEMY